MSQPPGTGSLTIDLALSLPAAGALRVIASDLVAKIAEFLGGAAAGASEAMERAAAQVAPAGADEEIRFEFQAVDRDLLIRAHCGARSSEVRYPLTL
jgi:hypothetical protein